MRHEKCLPPTNPGFSLMRSTGCSSLCPPSGDRVQARAVGQCSKSGFENTPWPKAAVPHHLDAPPSTATGENSFVARRRWSQKEDDLLARFGYQSPKVLQRFLMEELGSRRTLNAVRRRIYEMRIHSNLDGLKIDEMPAAFGVDVKTVRRWLESGAIRAVRRKGLDWFFPRREIRRFVLHYLEDIDLGKVEKVWFVDLLVNR